MPSAVLIVASTRVHADPQEILRIQDTVAALREQGRAVDVLVPRIAPLLTATLDPSARVFTAPRVPFMDDPPKRPSVRRLLAGVLMFLRGVALAPRRNYTILHGLNDGAIVARAIGCGTVRRLPYVADIQSPFCARALYHGLRAASARALERHSLRHAGAIIFPDEDTLATFDGPIPRPASHSSPTPTPSCSPTPSPVRSSPRPSTTSTPTYYDEKEETSQKTCQG